MKYDFHIYFIITYENHISLNLGKSKLSIKYVKHFYFIFLLIKHKNISNLHQTVER